MILDLDLSNISASDRVPFCQYLVRIIYKLIIEHYRADRGYRLEEYINDQKLIKWLYDRDKYITVRELYELAGSNLEIDPRSTTHFTIKISTTENIPESYTLVYNIVSLLEYGALGIRGYGLITKIMQTIATNLDTYYEMFKLNLS